jgi:tetratricopeptide (TPR) repeat protein
MGEADSYYESEALRYFQEGYQKQSEGDLESAIALYHKSLELYPTPEAYTFLGWAYSFQGRYDDAIEECRKAIAIDPDYGNPYNDIGSYLIEKGKLEEAVPWLEKATHAKRYESYCYPHYNLGRVWEKKGDWMRAIQAYQEALKENNEYTLARRALSRIQGLLN